jgi:hypothetical protein
MYQIVKDKKLISYLYFKNLSDNHIGLKGAEYIADMLKHNTTLTHLTVQGNNFDDSSAPLWASIIVSYSFMCRKKHHVGK